MSCDIEPAAPDGPVYRLGRAPDPWDWPDWAYAGTDGTFGNRYDDPGGEYRVLYASSERLGAFVETLARFRIDPVLVECQTDIAPQFRGIHYLSRLGDDIYNWAIFEPPAGTAPPITESECASLDRSDPDLAAALEHLGLRLVA